MNDEMNVNPMADSDEEVVEETPVTPADDAVVTDGDNEADDEVEADDEAGEPAEVKDAGDDIVA